MLELRIITFDSEKNQYNLPYWAYVDNNKLKIDHCRFADYIAEKFHLLKLPTNTDVRFFVWNGKVYRRAYKNTLMTIIRKQINMLHTDILELDASDEVNLDMMGVICELDTESRNLYNINQRDIVATYSAMMTADIGDDYTGDYENTDCTEVLEMDNFDTDEDCIVFNNGILRLSTMTLEPHNPNILSTMLIPVNWNPQCNKSPEVFTKFIRHLANYDNEQVARLLEVLGLAISNINVGQRCKKSVFLVGDGNCGKSIFINLLRELVGVNNFVAMPFDRLTERFALADLYGKRVAADVDCKYSSNSEISKFKQVSSGDTLSGEYKGETAFNFCYKGIYVVASNNLPLFSGDKGKWVYDRMLLVQCGESVPVEKQDKELLSHLMQEAESIVFLAVTALKKLMDNNYIFTNSAIADAMMNKYVVANNIYLSFIEECCMSVDNLDAEASCVLSIGDMYKACKKYINDIGCGVRPNRDLFFTAIKYKYNVDDLSLIIKHTSGRKSKCKKYYPFTLKPEYYGDYY